MASKDPVSVARRKAYLLKYSAEHKERRNAVARKWYRDNKVRAAANSAAWAAANAALKGERERARRLADPEKYRARAHTDKARWYRYRVNARNHDHPWELTFEQFTQLIRSPCAYCDPRGTVPAFGVDRVDNDRGYCPDNAVSCCKLCNRMKMDNSLPDFIRHVLKIADRFKHHAPTLLGKTILIP